MLRANAQHPKVLIVGAGSLFFGRQAIWQTVHSPHLNTGTLALVDTDPKRLERMARLAEMVLAANNVPLALEVSTERKDVLRGADFVFLSFADGRSSSAASTVRFRENTASVCAQATRSARVASFGRCVTFREYWSMPKTSNRRAQMLG